MVTVSVYQFAINNRNLHTNLIYSNIQILKMSETKSETREMSQMKIATTKTTDIRYGCVHVWMLRIVLEIERFSTAKPKQKMIESFQFRGICNFFATMECKMVNSEQ